MKNDFNLSFISSPTIFERFPKIFWNSGLSKSFFISSSNFSTKYSRASSISFSRGSELAVWFWEDLGSSPLCDGSPDGTVPIDGPSFDGSIILDGSVPLCDGTVPLCDGSVPLCDGSVPLCDGSIILDGSVPLCDGTVPLCDGSVPLCDGSVSLCDGSVPLDGSVSLWEGLEPGLDEFGSSWDSVPFCIEFFKRDKWHIERRFLFMESLKYNRKYEFKSSLEEKVNSVVNSSLPKSFEHFRLLSPPRIPISKLDCPLSICKNKNKSKSFMYIFGFNY